MQPTTGPSSTPFKPSHERMTREDGLYDICLVMDWNIKSRKRNGGSAIFFHLARPGYKPTEGCIAVSLPAMRRLVRFMRQGTMGEGDWLDPPPSRGRSPHDRRWG